MKPWLFELEYCDPFIAFQALQPSDNVIFFDSSNIKLGLGRYSFIAYSPFTMLKFQAQQSYLNNQPVSEAPFDLVAQQLQLYTLERLPDVPGFQGGAAGLFSYDLLTQLENVALPQVSYLPELAIGLYDLIIGFDNVEKKAWIISSGLPETEPKKREQQAEQRYRLLVEKLEQPITPLPEYTVLNKQRNFNQNSYCDAVNRAKNYILDGDIFEVCLSQRFTYQLGANTNPLSIYQQLRKHNPAPFSAYVKFGDLTLLSASPERFLQVNQGIVESRPIKGTVARSTDPIHDQNLAQQLMQSEKDKAENAMIVDLLRNDLSKVCEDNTVDVASFAHLESYATVHHLVSSISGRLRKDRNLVDLLKATFPGGSITGAPKIRAMEIISEIEPNNRGPYCGNLVYMGFDGTMDSSILIRTMVLSDQQLSFQAGGAIVLDSDAQVEYQETLDKAQALHTALSMQDSLV